MTPIHDRTTCHGCHRRRCGVQRCVYRRVDAVAFGDYCPPCRRGYEQRGYECALTIVADAPAPMRACASAVR